jgi:hypothetical protein
VEAGNEVIARRDHDIVGEDTSPCREDRDTTHRKAGKSFTALGSWVLSNSDLVVFSKRYGNFLPK